MKNHAAKETSQQAILKGQMQKMHPIVCDETDVELIENQQKEKRSSGPLRIKNRCRWVTKIIVSSYFGTATISSYAPQIYQTTNQEKEAWCDKILKKKNK